MQAGVCAVLVHVADMDAGLSWYRNAFPDAVLEVSYPSGFVFLRIGATQLEIVPADAKVGSGAAGSVVYWWVDDFARSLTGLKSAGAVLYRGPLEIDGKLWMCQLRDPWGNCIGIRGPLAANPSDVGSAT
ncbi:MAG TPA: glyoxalase/bleomycin resistance/dioxygenase family protein [Bosea sp. (in: a-proteobacteria)]|uniref:glyoxalase/bleomycin resistance/dioxygenase family protein n=1 Tax=Bosea sp. (in: a-proteobacteria) TaxID=1871050 RepID=UPI002E13CB24|nr:glyoxalase/bleomycin resistance/dioxygenase family protein [Bosea sp. (in: a-proteobacteria)]